MNSEKVKEIKDCLNREVEEFQSEFCQEILTLINELESENETIKLNMQETEKVSFNINQMNGNLVLENQRLKDRIDESEKQMCRNEDLHTATKKLNDMIILKQFAERLKEKERDVVFDGGSVHILGKGVLTTDIDETLEEFLK